jgi:4-diphosphocytidyl-2-C-methyl-D-erythritol kinase
VSGGAAQRATVRLAARAKINLRLNVLARESSGYHQIETLFSLLDFADDIEILLGGPSFRFEVESPDHVVVPADSENLVHRAALLFFGAVGKPPRATIRLKKRVPSGAGLGGGSSDAAVTLKGLNLLSGNPLTDEQLVTLGGSLGSDVPFFLCGSSLAFAWGRGQRLLPLEPLPSVPALLAIPPFPIATASAYEALSIPRESHAAATVISRQRLASWDAVRADASNDFEAALFPKHPLLVELKETLLDAGATLALLSGSGSTVFGLFELDRDVARASKRVRERFSDVRTVETRTFAWSAG